MLIATSAVVTEAIASPYATPSAAGHAHLLNSPHKVLSNATITANGSSSPVVAGGSTTVPTNADYVGLQVSVKGTTKSGTLSVGGDQLLYGAGSQASGFFIEAVGPSDQVTFRNVGSGSVIVNATIGAYYLDGSAVYEQDQASGDATLPTGTDTNLVTVAPPIGAYLVSETVTVAHTVPGGEWMSCSLTINGLSWRHTESYVAYSTWPVITVIGFANINYNGDTIGLNCSSPDGTGYARDGRILLTSVGSAGFLD
jgi:hypothetical protein